MTPEARRILDTFRTRGLRAGDTIHPQAIDWKDESVRQAFMYLVSESYILEGPAALTLTEKGDLHLYADAMPKYGARVYRVGQKILIKQTMLRGTPPEYVIDEQRERHVDNEDDSGISAAIRDALNGRL